MGNEACVDAEVLRAGAAAALTAAGMAADDAAAAAESMLAADLRGFPAHGVERLPGWLAALRDGTIAARPEVRVLHETPTSIALDAGNGLGYPAARRAMMAVIAKAEASGAAFGSVRNSSDFGIAAAYALLAAQRGAIGIAASNAQRSVVPTFARDPLLGPNPFAFAIPAGDEPPFVFDFSTANIGGTGTESGGHKGYGLGLLADILCGVLAGGAFGMALPLAAEGPQPGAISHFFAALRIDGFRDPAAFGVDLDAELRSLRASRPAPGHDRVTVAGERAHERVVAARRRGVPVSAEVRSILSAQQ